MSSTAFSKRNRVTRKQRHTAKRIFERLREFGQNPPSDDDTPRHEREIAVMDWILRLSPDGDDAPLRGL